MITKFFKYIRSYFATNLPIGLTEYNGWADSVIALSGLPDNQSTRFALAIMIMHLAPTENRKPKQFFVCALRKAAANEVANSVLQDLKEKHKAAATAEKAANDQKNSEAPKGVVLPIKKDGV